MTINYKISGSSEAVFIVADINKSKDFYVNTVGWDVLAGGRLSPTQLKTWLLAENVTGEYCLVAEPNSQGGYIRLVQLGNVKQEYIRANSQIWDTGGIFDVNVRVKNSFELSRLLHDKSWFGVNEPVEMQFGPFKVYEWLAKSHDGITHALIERLDPPLQDDQQVALFSQLINSSFIVKDHQQEKAFFENILGFESVIDQAGTFDEAKSNVFGMPFELVQQTPSELTLLSPDGGRFGTIELASFPQLTGNDFSNRAKAPNLGIVSLRFPVKNLDSLVHHLIQNNVNILSDCKMELMPYGPARIILIQSPAGNWLEFFESVTE